MVYLVVILTSVDTCDTVYEVPRKVVVWLP